MRIMFAETNQTYILKCPIEKKESKTFVDWSRDNTSLYIVDGYEILQKGHLKIKSVGKQHAGIYTCEGINGYGTVRVNITLIVDNPEFGDSKALSSKANSANRVYGSPPSIKKRHPNVVHETGGQATFHCVANGQPNPHIFWLKDGHLIQGAETEILTDSTHSSLKLRDLKKSDSGVYTCIARNIRGMDQFDFSLKVTDLSSPPRIVQLTPSTLTIKEGETAAFWCEVDSKPGIKLHIKWLKKVLTEDPSLLDDKTLFQSDNTYYRPLDLSEGTSSNDGVSKSKLMIRNARKEDSGAYVCLALNDKGFNVRNVTLTVIGTASTMPNLRYFPTNSTSLVIAIIIGFIVILAAIVLISHLYCRGGERRSPIKTISESQSEKNSETNKNLTRSATSTRAYIKKDVIVYPEINDPQLTSKLLNCDLRV